MRTSQIGQDDWVITQLQGKKRGVFVDVGAFDGYSISNTYALEKAYNWTGVCVEPNPEPYSKLIVNRDCVAVNAACVRFATSMKLAFAVHDNPVLSKLDDGGDTEVEALTLNAVCDMTGTTNIDYISLDTEGNECELLKSFDMNRFNVTCWTIEHNGRQDSLNYLVDWMTQHNYLWRIVRQDVFAVRDMWSERLPPVG